MTDLFAEIFKQSDDPKRLRGKFLSRLFGIISEEIVKIWARDPRAPYANEGRPTIRLPIDNKGHTLDFTLRSRETGKAYATELKCEIEYKGYKYLILTDPSQLVHHDKPAFRAFLDAAAGRRGIRLRVSGADIEVDGAILIWGVVTAQGRMAVMEKYGFADVLSVADMVEQLRQWGNAEYCDFLQQFRRWSNEMYDGLLNFRPDDSCSQLETIQGK